MKLSTVYGLIVLATAVLLAGAAFAKGDNDFNVLPKNPDGQFSSVVRLGGDADIKGDVDGKSDDVSCTAFYIGEGKFVSAGHCMSPSAYGNVKWVIYATNENGGSRRIKPDFSMSSIPFDYQSEDFSVAFVDPSKVDDFQPLPIDCNYKPAIGDDLTAEGFPMDLGRIVTKGFVAAVKETPWALWSHPLIRAQLPISNGNSGSPVFFNDKVIGIAVGALPRNQTLSVIEPISVVCRALGIK